MSSIQTLMYQAKRYGEVYTPLSDPFLLFVLLFHPVPQTIPFTVTLIVVALSEVTIYVIFHPIYRWRLFPILANYIPGPETSWEDACGSKCLNAY